MPNSACHRKMPYLNGTAYGYDELATRRYPRRWVAFGGFGAHAVVFNHRFGENWRISVGGDAKTPTARRCLQLFVSVVPSHPSHVEDGQGQRAGCLIERGGF
jgi:hypothetical protein